VGVLHYFLSLLFRKFFFTEIPPSMRHAITSHLALQFKGYVKYSFKVFFRFDFSFDARCKAPHLLPVAYYVASVATSLQFFLDPNLFPVFHLAELYSLAPPPPFCFFFFCAIRARSNRGASRPYFFYPHFRIWPSFLTFFLDFVVMSQLASTLLSFFVRFVAPFYFLTFFTAPFYYWFPRLPVFFP